MPLVPDAQAQHAQPDDVIILGGVNYMVRDVKEKNDKVRVLTSTGRTDPGEWMEFAPTDPVQLWRVRL